ncbi:hypothetical protein [Novosphingobium sp.]|uniref:hypothetical protein n=1 Tax=Novosphingobium sp. TaxID=1874826 RepID=UPI003D14053E
MCAPIIAAGLGAVGTGISTISAMNQARAQAAAANANAAAESNAAQIGEQNMRDAALQQYRQMAAVSGEQNLTAAANGDAIGYGTAANALKDTQILGQENLARIYAQGNQNLMGSDIAVSNDLGQAAAAKNRSTAALVGGLINLGSGLVSAGTSGGLSAGFGGTGGGLASGSMSTALGGASQYGPFKAGIGL